MKVFWINFLVFSIVFGVIYLAATSSGAAGALGQDVPLWKAFGGVVIAISAFSFWVTMLMDCFMSEKTRNKLAWGIGLVFFSWVAAIAYFFLVYRKDATIE